MCHVDHQTRSIGRTIEDEDPERQPCPDTETDGGLTLEAAGPRDVPERPVLGHVGEFTVGQEERVSWNHSGPANDLELGATGAAGLAGRSRRRRPDPQVIPQCGAACAV